MSPLDLLVALLPWPLKRLVYRMRGWEIGPGARVGFSVVAVDHLVMGANARIGHGNLLCRLGRLELGEGASIGNFNRAYGPREYSDGHTSDWPSRMTLGDRTVIYSSNFFDVADRIEIGSDVLVSGGFSRFWTHETAEHDDGGLYARLEGITIGDGCIVGAGSMLLPGCVMPERATLGAGSVLTKRSTVAPGTILFGNPARAISTTPKKEPSQ